MELSNLLNELYEDIKHGDDEHKKWLKEKIESFIQNKCSSNTPILDDVDLIEEKFNIALDKVLTAEVGEGIVENEMKELCKKYASIGFEFYSKLKPSWIYISKRLPADGNRVWIYSIDEQGHYHKNVAKMMSKEQKEDHSDTDGRAYDGVWFDDYELHHPITNVICWMPYYEPEAPINHE